MQTVTMLCYEMMKREPAARAIVLAADLYEQLVAEQASDLPEEDRVGLRLFVEDYGVPVLCDEELRPGACEYISWPDALAYEDYSPWDSKPWERR